ncbi:gelsolin isoform X2 [Sitodiplosis mosellana]|uniref:gelsolin isoform X2 n=1 Tax=Sitodiplosis mosellana TaxID=263140 RepID=UPI0024441E1C|nr:gelsolin isoform X2 [Sitodiplosis mosellana]
MAEAGVLRASRAFHSVHQTLSRAATLCSLLLVLSLTSVSLAATTGGRASAVIPQPATNIQGNKNSRPTVMHSAFTNAGRAAGLEIWRVENFEPVAVPRSDHGKFFTGDSYIVLNTKSDSKKKLSWDVHFWLGLETSRDEAGAAAILTVQLDDLLGGAPVQYREVQEHESAKFLGYFRNSIRYVAGGVASGFSHVTTNDGGQKRLFQVKGKRNVRVREIGLSVSNMNKGDCFILENNRDIYVYVGPSSKRVEKLKAISAANQIRDQDHNGRASVHILDEFSTLDDKEDFFRVLGSGSADKVPEDSTAEEDAAFETSDAAAVTLYKVTDAGGSLKVETISTKPIRQEMLKSEDCFILDTGSALYVWVGRGATQQEKSQSIVRAQNFIQSKKYPSWTPVHRIVENAETAPFKQYFATWRDIGMQHTRLIRAAKDIDSDSGMEDEIDPNEIRALKKSGGRALGFMPDNGEGDVEIWRIDNSQPVATKPTGILFGSKAYVLKYHYKHGGEEGVVIYYWQGKNASSKDKASSAMYTSQLDRELNDIALQVRVVQGFEPRHFLKIFKGKLITYTHDDAADKTHLFRIRGTCAEDVRADERDAIASSLASDDVFILRTPSNAFIWNGLGASKFEKEMASVVINAIAPNIDAQIIDENAEPAAFWAALNGKGEYDTELDPPGAPFLEPRLFHCKLLANGKLRVEEVDDFDQEDLDEDDVMIMDGGDEVYVWEGKDSSHEERRKSIEVAHQYIRNDPSERSEESAVIVRIRQGNEPRSFKRLFPTWNNDMWKIEAMK